jgi:hypothetical protein
MQSASSSPLPISLQCCIVKKRVCGLLAPQFADELMNFVLYKQKHKHHSVSFLCLCLACQCEALLSSLQSSRYIQYELYLNYNYNQLICMHNPT